MRKKATNKLKTPLVLASSKPHTRSTMPEYEIATYKCSCGHCGAVQASLDDPHCVSCGAGVKARKEVKASVGRLEHANSTTSLECAHCGVHNLMDTKVALAFAGTINCTACGEELAYDVDDVDDSVDLTNDTGSDDLVDQYDDDDDQEHADVDDIEDEDQDESDDEEVEASLDDDDEDIEDLTEISSDDEDPSEADAYLGGDLAESDEELDDADMDEDESVVSKVKPTPVIATLSEKALAKPRLVVEPGRIHVFARNTCLATLKEDADNSKIFGSKNHLTLIQASLENEGIAPTLSNFGFSHNTVKLSKAKALEATVASITSDSEAKVKAKLKEQSKVMKQSLEIASLGLNRDAYANEGGNPLKDGVVAMLVSMGVDKVTASLKTQQVFAQASDEFVEVLLKKAQEISSQSPVVRSQLASTFASMSPPSIDVSAIVKADAEEDQEVEDENDEYFDEPQEELSRLANPMRQSATASTSTNQTPRRSLFAKGSLSAFSK